MPVKTSLFRITHRDSRQFTLYVATVFACFAITGERSLLPRTVVHALCSKVELLSFPDYTSKPPNQSEFHRRQQVNTVTSEK